MATSHLPIPNGLEGKAISVSHLQLAPPYDFKGMRGFPERCGVNSKALLSSEGPNLTANTVEGGTNRSREWYTSLLQEWLWFGVLHAFGLTCGVPMDWDELMSCQSLETTWLLPYGRRVVVAVMCKRRIPIDMVAGDQVYLLSSSSDIDEVTKANNEKVARSFGPFAPHSNYHGPYQIEEKLSAIKHRLQAQDGHTFEVSVMDMIPIDFATRIPSSQEDAAELTQDIPVADLLENIRFTSFHDPSQEDADYPLDQVKNAIRSCILSLNHLMEQDDPLFNWDMMIATYILCESLQVALERLFRYRAPLEQASMCKLELERRMREASWCPSRTNKILSTTTEQLCYLLSLLPSFDTRSHRDCSTNYCAHQLAATDHQSLQHNSQCLIYDCDVITVAQDDLIKFIQAGKTPGLRACSTGESLTGVTVCDVSDEEYIAISHVWSQGLGNSLGNSLQRCQLEYLFQKAGAISTTPVALWLDTLCVPFSKIYRGIAISQMGSVYENATKVLIIDKYVAQVGSNWLERRLQLLSSEWQRRLWTMQEGQLSIDPWIQFEDSAAPVTSLSESYVRANMVNSDADLYHHLQFITGSVVKSHFVEAEDAVSRIWKIRRDLSVRTTTLAEDEPFCLAILTRAPPETIRKGVTMETVFRNLTVLPRDFLEIPGPRLRTPGFRSLPETLLNHGHQVMASTRGGLLLSEGFMVQVCSININDEIRSVRNPHKISDVYLVDVANLGEVVVYVEKPDENSLVPEILVKRPKIVLTNDFQHLYETGTSKGVLTSHVPHREISSDPPYVSQRVRRIVGEEAVTSYLAAFPFAGHYHWIKHVWVERVSGHASRRLRNILRSSWNEVHRTEGTLEKNDVVIMD